MAFKSIADLRSRISTALSGELGTYTYENGQTATALRVDTGAFTSVGGVIWEEKPTVTGLEVVIVPEFDYDFNPIHAGEYTLDKTTRIVVKQWSLTDTVLTAVGLLIVNLSDVITNVGPRLLRNSTLDSIESQTLTIIHQ